MKHLLSFVCLFILCSATPAYACMNGESKILSSHQMVYHVTDFPIPFKRHYYTEKYPEIKRELDSLYRSTHNMDYLSDLGFMMIMEGKYKEAVDLYLSIEKTHPNRYSTASNIGTAYELLGDYTNALKWIQRSVEINPEAHHRSEWIHVNILKAELNKAYLNSDSLIGTSFGNELQPTTTLTAEERERLHEAILYQLNERMSFIKDSNGIVALLLFDLGNILFLHNMPYLAKEAYEQAKDYGFNTPLFAARVNYVSILLDKRRIAERQKDERRESYRAKRKLDIQVAQFAGAFVLLLLLGNQLWVLKK